MATSPLFILPSLRHLEQAPASRADPSPLFQLLRERRVCLDRELGSLVLARFEDVRQALSSPALSTSFWQRTGQTALAHMPFDGARFGMEQTGDLRNGVSHLRLRAILREALGPAALRRRRIEQGIEHIGRVLLARIEARGAGYFDLISDLTAPLSLHVLVALVGLPTHQVHLARFACWMEALASVSDQFDTPPPSQDVTRMCLMCDVLLGVTSASAMALIFVLAFVWRAFRLQRSYGWCSRASPTWS